MCRLSRVIFVQDLKERPNDTFGGATVLLSCDMRQTLPVMPGASTGAILTNLFSKSMVYRKVSSNRCNIILYKQHMFYV